MNQIKSGIEIGFINSKVEIEQINKRLTDIYGRDDLKRPKFRIVWSEDLFEQREGNFHGDNAIELARKYNYIKNKWVFESLMPEAHGYDGYEPFFTFADKKGNALPVQWLICELLVTMWMHRADPEFNIPVPTEEEVFNTNYMEFLEVISNESTDFGASLNAGETVVLTGKEFK